MASRQNKRRYVRTRAQNLVAHLRVGDRLIQAPIDDISMGGMLARTQESIAIGTAVMFDLARPGLKKPLRLLGVVVDTRVGRGLGIRFDGLDKEAGDRLGELINDLGGLTSSLLVDKPDAPADQVPRTVQVQGPASPAPVTVNPFRTPTTTGAQAGQSVSENEAKLLAQMRSMVMEVGRLQEVVQQREKEVHDARSEVARLKADANAGDAAQRVVGKLEIEKNKLEGQMARVRQDVEAVQREAQDAVAALQRMIDALNRLR